MTDVKVHDFEKSKKYKPSQMRFLNTYIENFVKASNLQLQYELKNRCNMKIELKEVYQEQYGDFLENMDYDSVNIDFSIEDRITNLIYNLDKKVALVIVDCLLGSDGKVNVDKNLTEIDKEILNYITDSLFRKTSDFADMSEACINGIYTNKAQYSNPNGGGTIFVSILDFYLNNENIGKMKMCVPFESIENVIEELMAKKTNNNSKEHISDVINTQMLESMFENQVTLDVVAELGSTDLTVKELLSLEVGDAFMLHRKIEEDIDVTVGGQRAYFAKPGKVASNNAIVIVDSVEGEEAEDERENE